MKSHYLKIIRPLLHLASSCSERPKDQVYPKSQPLKVVINGRFLGRQMTGVDRFAFELVSAIDAEYARNSESVDGIEMRLAVPPSFARTQYFDHIPVFGVGTGKGQFWEQSSLLSIGPDELLVNLCNSGPLLRRNQLTVIHDAATVRVPSSYSWRFRLWYGIAIPRLFHRSISICTVSEFSKRELVGIYGPRPNLAVLPEGIDHIRRTVSTNKILEQHKLGSRPYILAVSSLAPHKNFSIILKAISLVRDIDFDVVIAGGGNSAVFSEKDGTARDLVKYVGYVSDGELKALYENAICFVFPSLYEGYGLPPTEAMACGCPVVAADAAAIPEVCGGAVLYFNPDDPASLASVLQCLIPDKDLQRNLRELGLNRVSGMRWDVAAKALLREIRRVAP